MPLRLLPHSLFPGDEEHIAKVASDFCCLTLSRYLFPRTQAPPLPSTFTSSAGLLGSTGAARLQQGLYTPLAAGVQSCSLTELSAVLLSVSCSYIC